MKRYAIILLLLNFINVYSQEQKSTEYDLPENLDDAIAFLEFKIPNDVLLEFKNQSERDAVAQFHMSVGLTVRNNWVRHGNPKFVEYFNDLGIDHPDDISSIVITSLHRKLNGKSLKLEKQVRRYKRYWKKALAPELKAQNIFFKKFKIGDTLTFKYLRTFVSNNQFYLDSTGVCTAKAILVDKRKSDFNLLVKLIESCDPIGINIIDYTKDNFSIEIMKVGDTRWNFYNDWNPYLPEKRRK